MSKNLNVTLINDLVNTLLNAVETKDDTSWLDEMIASDLSLDDLLGTSMREVSDEEIINKQNKEWNEKLKKATEIMNKNIEEAVNKVNNKERKILVDSPVKVEKCKCGCDKPATECSKSKKSDTLNVKNAFKAETLKTPEVKEESKVRLINVNKTAEKALERIYTTILEVRETGGFVFDFLAEGWDDLLENVRATTVEKVINRVANHLIENGFDVATSVVYDDDSIVEMSMAVDW